MTSRTAPHVIAGAALPVGDTLDVVNPWDGSLVGRVAFGGGAEVAAAVAAAGAAMARPLPAHERARLLDAVAALVARDRELLAGDIVAESGKPLRAALAEADRAVATFTFAAVEARTLAGDVVPVDAAANGTGRVAFTVREPRGVLAAISPFNFPLNLVAHKVAPGLAAGCGVVLKPAEKTPLTAARLADLVHEAGWPAGWLNVVHGRGEDTVPPLVADRAVAVVSFTGSTRVGQRLAASVPGKPVHLELGSNAPLLVQPSADLDRAVAAIRLGGFGQAGQSCVSTQRVLAHADVYEPLLDRLGPAVASLAVGDPADPKTEVGPLIRAAEADRVLGWVRDAVAGGARLVTGGRPGPRPGLLEPTVLADVDPDMTVCREEVFGPVVTVAPYAALADGIAAANDSPYGLNASIYTADLADALQAARELHAGQVLVNETTAWRADNMPYGGVGESGDTREGPRWAVRAFTREKLVVLNP